MASTDPQALSGQAQIDALIRVNLDDFLDSLGLAKLRFGRGLLEAIFRPSARRFAEQIATFDQINGDKGLPAGADWLLKHYMATLEVAGRAQVPDTGPLLVVCNHPGMADTIALFVALGRPDLRIIANDRPFLRALPNATKQLIRVPEGGERLSVVRSVLANLKAGRAVVTFPAGKIEPDPGVMPGARASLDAWSDSATLFAQRVPETVIVPAIVSGVQSAGAQRNPLRMLRRQEKDRDKMAAGLQILLPRYRGVPIRVCFGPPMKAADLLRDHPEPGGLHAAVLAAAGQLIDSPPAEWRLVAKGNYASPSQDKSRG